MGFRIKIIVSMCTNINDCHENTYMITQLTTMHGFMADSLVYSNRMKFNQSPVLGAMKFVGVAIANV